MAQTLQDGFAGASNPLTTADGYSSSYLHFQETGGVAVPLSYDADQYLIDDTVYSAGHRFTVTLGGTTLRDCALICCLADTTDITSDHIKAKFTMGSVAPGSGAQQIWSTPDTITILKTVATVESEVTPTNTSSQLRTPFVDNTISLRDERLKATDTIGIQVVSDGTDAQVFVYVNGIIRAHEKVTGVTVSGSTGILNYDSTGDNGNNTYDDWYGGNLTPRFVTTTGSDVTGTGTAAAPWENINYALDTAVTDEIILIAGGTYNDRLTLYQLDGVSSTLRVPTSLTYDAVLWAALADATVTNSNSICFHAKSPQRFFYSYNIHYRTTSTVNSPVNWHSGGGATMALDGVIQGGSVKDTSRQGIALFSGSDNQSRAKVLDVWVKGTGFNVATQNHNIYTSGQDVVIAWNLVDGYSTVHAAETRSFGIHVYNGNDTTDGNNNAVVKYNECLNHTRPGTVGGGGIIMSHGSGMQCYGNYCHGNKTGIYAWYKQTATKVFNNIVVDNVVTGIAEGGTVVGGNLIYHNTIANNGTNGLWVSGAAGSTSLNAIANGNIIYTHTDDVNVHASAVNFTQPDNWVEDESDADPAFLSDYSLNGATSPCLSGGPALSATVYVDARGYLKTQQTTPAYGAFEVPLPPTTAPTVNMNTEYTGNINVSIAIAPSVTDPDNDATKAYINVTGTLTLSIDGTGVTAKGGT